MKETEMENPAIQNQTIQLENIVTALSQRLCQLGWMMASAESCTGGLIAAACTELAGSSRWFERGFVTYSNAAKAQDLGIDPALIATHGAVSEAVARAMAEGAARRALTQVALSVTGIAGPAGGTAAKPVGTVCFGWWVNGRCESHTQHWPGHFSRAAIRSLAREYALQGLLQRI